MIRVEAQPEPEDFDARVRQPGRLAIATGLSPLPPYWREALPQLHRSYGGICAYLSIRIPFGVGSRSTDHFVAKSREVALTYEWSNYRLACSLMNARKGSFTDILDPFEIQDGWFVLELSALQVLPSPDLPENLQQAVQATIDRLDLNDDECLKARGEAFDNFLQHGSPRSLEKQSPFLARELRRQGWI